MFQLVETNISYSIWLKVLLVLSSNPTYKFLLCVFRCTHLKSIIHWAWSRFSRHHKKKTNLKVLFALSERHPSVWGHEHKSRTSEHINANQATLHFLAETRFVLFMLNPQTQRWSLFWKIQGKSTGTGISDRKPHAGYIPPTRTHKIDLELQLNWLVNKSNQAAFTWINELCSSTFNILLTQISEEHKSNN